MSEKNPPGFGERSQAEFTAASLREALFKPLPRYEKLKLGEGGRVVIPAALREAMDVAPGDTLIANVENGELRLITRRMAFKRAREKATKYRKPGESVVDEFLAERRAMWGEE